MQPGCIEGQTAAGLDPLSCGSVHVFYKYIKTPLFVLENQYDTNQLYAQVCVCSGTNASWPTSRCSDRATSPGRTGRRDRRACPVS